MSFTPIYLAPSLSACRICQIVKNGAGAQLPNVAEGSIVNQYLSHNLTFLAIVLAVHDLDKKILYAVLAPKTAQDDLKDQWKVAGSCLGLRLKCGDNIYICVPLDQNATHLPLDDCVLWYVLEPELSGGSVCYLASLKLCLVT